MRKVFIGLFAGVFVAVLPSVVFAEEVVHSSNETEGTIIENVSTEVNEAVVITEEETEGYKNKDSVIVPYKFKSSVHVYALPDSFIPDNSYNRNWIKSTEYTDIGKMEAIGEVELIPGYYQFSDEFRHNVLVKVEEGKYYRWDRSCAFIDHEIIEADPNYWDTDYTPTMNIGFKNEVGEILNNVFFSLIYNGKEIPVVESNYMYYAEDDTFVMTEDVVYNTFSYLSYGDYCLHVNQVPAGYVIPADKTINLSEKGIVGANEFGTVFISLDKVKEEKKDIVKSEDIKDSVVKEEMVKSAKVKNASVSNATVAAPTGDNTLLYSWIALGGLAGIVFGIWKTKKR